MCVFSIISNQISLVFLAVLGGFFLGKIKIAGVGLGNSGPLFVALLEGWFFTVLVRRTGCIDYNVKIPAGLFHFSLVLFIAAVGLKAGEKMVMLLKEKGIGKFILLGFSMTFVGMLSVLLLNFLMDSGKYIFVGLFTGALTSSPGLAAALDISQGRIGELIGYGYALGYVPGILSVILFIEIVSKYVKKTGNTNYFSNEKIKKKKHFDFAAFSLVMVIGTVIGSLKLFSFRMGLTGGVLISSLFFGSLKKIGPFNFVMDEFVMDKFKELGLLLFLSCVGLKYGYTTISSLNGRSILYMFFAFIIAFLPLVCGFLLGKYVFGFDWELLSGAICGGMTSTPGLGVAIENTNSKETSVGYGAVYPFALIGMVLFVSFLKFMLKS